MGGWEAASTHRDFAGREPQSWGESLQFYRHAQINRPFADDQYKKPPRVTRYEISRKEAEYNPITQTWRDVEREQAARRRDAEDTLRAQNRAKDRQLDFERSSHDVLTQERKRAGLLDPQAAMGLTFPVKQREQRLAHPMDSMVPYNIISGLSVEEHHWAPPDQRPRPAPPREDTKLRSITQQPRDYNVLSNKYKRDHERRTAEEDERARRRAAEKFWATHDYNIMTQEFYDPDKEAQFQELKKNAEAEHTTRAFNKLPPSYQKGEGYVYSITNFSVQNPELYRTYEEKEKRAIDSKATRWHREAEIVEKAEERAAIETTRSSMRPSHNRYEENTSHGYDIITTKGYHDRDPASKPPARTQPKPTAMENLTTSANSFWQTRSTMTASRFRAGADGMGSGRGAGGGEAAVPPLDIDRATAQPPPQNPLEMTGGSSARPSVRTGGFAR